MSPQATAARAEQWTGFQPDVREDVFALSVILYLFTTGRNLPDVPKNPEETGREQLLIDRTLCWKRHNFAQLLGTELTSTPLRDIIVRGFPTTSSTVQA